MTKEAATTFFPCLAQILPAADACNIGRALLPMHAKNVPDSFEHLWAEKTLSYSLMALQGACGLALMFNMHETRRRGFLRTSLCGPGDPPTHRTRISLSSITSFQYTILHPHKRLIAGQTYTLTLDILDDISDGISVCGCIGDSGTGELRPVWIVADYQRRFVPRFTEQPTQAIKCILVRPEDHCENAPYIETLSGISNIVLSNKVLDEWSRLLCADVVAFHCIPDGLDRQFDQAVFTLHRHGVITIGMARDAESKKRFQPCHYTIDLGLRPHEDRSLVHDNVQGRISCPTSEFSLAKCVADFRNRRLPAITIILLKDLHEAWVIAERWLQDLTVCIRTVDSPNSVSQITTELQSSDQLTILLLTPHIADIAQLVRMFVFEHFYPEVGACFGAIRAGSDANGPLHERDARCLSVQGKEARDRLLQVLEASRNNFVDVGLALGVELSRAGIVQRTLASPQSAPIAEPDHRFKSSLPERAMHWIRRKATQRVRRAYSSRSSRLRILAYRWHVPHQAELMRLPADFTLACGFPLGITERWSYNQRPMPRNARFVHFSEIDAKDYDLAIVHFDENVLCPELSNGILPIGWGEPFKWLMSIVDLPKIGICHGTPPFKGQYGILPVHADHFEADDEQRLMLVDLLAAANVFVVCNSFQAETEWKFAASRTIWHGFDPLEFKPQPSIRDVLASPLDRTRPHYRGLAKQQQILDALDPSVRVMHKLKRTPLEMDNTPAFSHRQFWYYAQQIASFKLYLNTTLRSPMPRSRGEAMMAGVAPVSLANHDVQMFIENGVDGFYADDPGDIATFINDSFRDLRGLEAMRIAARRKAIEVFHVDRFKDDWLRLIKDVIGWAPSTNMV